MIHYRCPECQSPLESPDEDAGHEFDCPCCQAPHDVPPAPRRRDPLLLIAAWISPVLPVVAAGVVLAGAPWNGTAVMGLVVLVCALGGISGIVGLIGVVRNGVAATVPASTLGILLNGGVGFLALLAWGLSGLPRC